jgi:hypothetical protein
MCNREKFLILSDITAGDMLLCYEKTKFYSIINFLIKKETDSNYTHAAICIGNGMTAGAKLSGLKIFPIDKLARRYDHLAVFRLGGAWSSERTEKLGSFARAAIEDKAKYNFSAIFGFTKRKEAIEINVYERLANYFEGSYRLASPKKARYLCSEFVVACFTHVGIIQESDSIVYQPDTLSPGALGRDATFGLPIGYFSKRKNYVVPTNDEFYLDLTLLI